MSDSSQALLVPLVAALLGVAVMAVFSGLETGFYSANRVRLAVRVARGRRDARVLDGERKRPTHALIALLLSINVAGFIQAWGVAAVLDAQGFGPAATTAINFIVLLPVVFLLGDLLPKELFRLHADSWTYRLAWMLRTLRLAFAAVGVIATLDALARVLARAFGASEHRRGLSSREELVRMVQEGEGAGLLEARDMDVASRILAVRTTRVLDRIVPWSRVVTISAALTPAERSEALRACAHTRVPVIDESGRVVGMLATIDAVLAPSAATATLMATAIVLRPETPVGTALRLMRAHRTQSAIVGGVDVPLGLVTLKDLVRPLVGEAAWLGA